MSTSRITARGKVYIILRGKLEDAMNRIELVKQGYLQLVTEGQNILSECGWDGSNVDRYPPDNVYTRFRTQALNLIRRSCGENSDHYQELKMYGKDKVAASNSYYFPHCLGILEAAQKDFESGLLFNIRQLIRAELLDDFIEQAETLLDTGYYVPAASLAGAILEDTLRKLCDKHDITIPKSTKLDQLNIELAKEEVYGKLIQKRITAIADIRNNADHGNFDEFKSEDVKDMVKWIRSFVSDYLN